MAIEAKEISYDEVQYPMRSFPSSHPDHLAVIGTLFGMNPVPVDCCRVLELGCAQGGNLIPMAQQYPESEFLGVDLSEKQVEVGRKVIEAAGLNSVRLERGNILDFRIEEGRFDYIIAHGLYSWVSEDVREKILDICDAQLNPEGIAYVSYNTYPGWHMHGAIRDMMLYHIAQFDDPKTKVEQAAALVKFLTESVPDENTSYGMFLKSEMEKLKSKSGNYVIHDFLEQHNEPFYFHEFLSAAKKHGLQYLGESEFQSMLASNLSATISKTLREITRSQSESEQYMDFIRNRAFRQTLLCHKEVKLTSNIDANSVRRFSIGTRLRPDSHKVNLEPEVDQVFSVEERGQVTIKQSVAKAFFSILSEQSPQYCSFEDTLEKARDQIEEPQDVAVEKSNSEFKSNLCEYVMECFTKKLVDFRLYCPTFVNSAGDRPCVGPLARIQAKSGYGITNQLHLTRNMGSLNRHVITLLDGRCDRLEIVERLLQMVEKGTLTFKEEGEPLLDPHRIRAMLEESLEDLLGKLAKNAYLVS